MSELIKTKPDLCTGCNRCVRECPMEMANVTYKNDDGEIKVKVDPDKCITCGRCFSVCKHNARCYEDDTEKFFGDLANGASISLIAAPSIRINIPEYKRLFTYLKNAGVQKIYDVALGADICTWAHIRYIEQNGASPFIAQPCPVIVSYCETYRHELLKNLSPIHSPMACIAIYMREYEGIGDGIAALSPCIAKSNEFQSTNLTGYNVTFTKMQQYLEQHEIVLPQEETGFDHHASGLGSLFPMPGGLKENIDFYFDREVHVAKSEGYNIYNKLDIYATTPAELLPDIFDVLNCEEGCNIGSAVSCEMNVFEIGFKMKRRREKATDDSMRKYYKKLYQEYDDKFELTRFMRTYRKVETESHSITEEDIAKAFAILGKSDYEKQHVDCGACGSATCYNMARKIALGVNIPTNCMVMVMETARSEHEQNLAVHEQVASMEKLREADDRMKVMLNANSNVNIIFNSRFQIVDCNTAAIKSLGFETKEEMIAGFSEKLTKCIPAYQSYGRASIPFAERFTTVMKEGFAKFETDMVIDGTPRTWSVELRQIPYGDDFAIVGYVYDLTEVHLREMELQRTREQLIEAVKTAEAANRAKSDFLNTMSHEIRTPMNAILGITEIQLQNENLDANVKEALDRIYMSGDILLGIINDILDLSKIELGKLELIIDKYEIASLISDTAQLNMMRIGSKPIEFELHIDENLPTLLYGDELRVKQVLNNILSNAFKYTASGTVKFMISAEAREQEDSHGDVNLTVVVSDTGQGMTAEQVNKLFEKYTRFNMEANRSTEGTGLGMSITRNLLELMNGEIHVDSEPGKGSAFTIRIPQGRVGTDVLGKELAKNLQQFRSSSRAQMKRVQITREYMPYGRVLIVDDVETNIYVARGLLTPYGVKMDSADSGYMAIEKVKDGCVYDIVFMDHMMPKMDGIEATRILRDMGYSGPIVALTANAVVGQADIFLRNGFTDFISKPIDIRQLNTVLNKLIRDKQPPEVLEAARRQSEEQKLQTAYSEQPVIEPRFSEAFVRDARKSLAKLEEFLEKGDAVNEDDLRTYTIHVHGMKSALANIGNMELSAVAYKLEVSGRNGDIDLIAARTPSFLASLRKLVLDLTMKDRGCGEAAVDADPSFLWDKLLAMREACERYDKKTARGLLAELKEKKWAKTTAELLNIVSEHLLHSDFDEIISALDEFAASGK